MSFDYTENRPIAHPGPAPDACDLVVIGAGIVGVCTAIYAARSGLKVTLLEKGRVAGEQSSRNWGWIRQTDRDPAELPIMKEAIGLWRDLAEQCDEDIGLRQNGVMYLGLTPKDIARYERWLKLVSDQDVDSHILSRNEVKKHIPDAVNGWEGALWTPSDMRAEPTLAVPALARLAASEGVVIVENCAVRCLDVSGGEISGVITETGRIKASQVVLAGGAWSSLLLRREGVNIPQLSVRSSALATTPLPNIFDGAAGDSKIAFRRRIDGGYTVAIEGYRHLFVGPDAFRAVPPYLKPLIADPFGTGYRPIAPKNYPDAWGTQRRWSADQVSPFEKMRVLNPAPLAKAIDEITALFIKTFPGIGDVKVAQSWAGMIDVLPDIVPIIDHCAALPGLVIATGMCGHGFGIGPGIGKVVAQLVAGKTPSHDLSRFRFGRFSDGSKLTIGH